MNTLSLLNLLIALPLCGGALLWLIPDVRFARQTALVIASHKWDISWLST